jgi:maltose alpha-D-glucosyltransferase/alpha-amylase
MVRSFHYAASSGLTAMQERGLIQDDDLSTMEFWAAFWHNWVSTLFVRAYLNTAGEAGFLSRSGDELLFLMDVYLLEKAVYELGYELNNRPHWVKIPLEGMENVLSGISEPS